MSISFEGKVAIVTGAGNGLGKSHALELARRGAKVVINDLGGARDGSGSSSEAADAVVAEIKAMGGEAISNGANVAKFDEVEAMVKAAMDTWGRVDILVNNAGILRDKTFVKGSLDDFKLVLDVHVMGTVNCCKAVWEIMREQGYGRIVNTTSSSGLYGNFGQSNYGAAKMAVVGLMNTLVLEGAKYGIQVNCLSPCAATRMTEDLMQEEHLALLTPESVTAGLVYLVSDDAPNRTILSAGAGGYARAIVYETDGIAISADKVSAEAVAEHFAEIENPENQKELKAGGEQTVKFLLKSAEVNGISMG